LNINTEVFQLYTQIQASNKRRRYM